MSTIGIIGGGQLGRMLALAAARLNFNTVILDPQPGCPAAQAANRQIVGAYDDPQSLTQLAEACDFITYEFENVPVQAAQILSETCPVRPSPRALDVAQDRVSEKRFLNDSGIATADFRVVDSQSDLEAALSDFGGNGVLKTRRMGYDGKGQMVFRADEAHDKNAFAALGNVPLILESFVPFVKEISIIAARGVDGTIACYDPAENVHRSGILHTSTVPAGIAQATTDAAGHAAETILAALDYVGVIGVELFVLADGTLIANEIAPRVHNSGHWTETACVISQFEQHIRAVTGLPLGSTRRHSDCVMQNLIGDDINDVPQWLTRPDALLHLYGKREARPGRKMGHVTWLTKTPASLLPDSDEQRQF